MEKCCVLHEVSSLNIYSGELKHPKIMNNLYVISYWCSEIYTCNKEEVFVNFIFFSTLPFLHKKLFVVSIGRKCTLPRRHKLLGLNRKVRRANSPMSSAYWCPWNNDVLDMNPEYLNLKGKTLLVVVNKPFVFSSILKQNMIFSVFSVAYWMVAKIQISSK